MGQECKVEAVQPAYPWKCRKCREVSVRPVIVDYAGNMEYDGRNYQVTVSQLEVLECATCHSRIVPDDSWVRFDEEFRKQAGLLLPAEIKNNRKQLKLKQRELAGLLGIAVETLSRWEKGRQIQQRSLDRFMRCFFGFPEVQSALANEARLQALGVSTSQAVAASAMDVKLRSENSSNVA
jgi:putative zinc finger/helix-turn-helix YgiT family protein